MSMYKYSTQTGICPTGDNFMKKIKDLLNEFRDNNNSGGDNNDGNDHFARIKQFMEKTPFTHVTTKEDEINFASSDHALDSVSTSLAKHEIARAHAARTGNEPMHEYFLGSAGTHDDVLDALTEHIVNHPKLPPELKHSVPLYINHVSHEAERKTLQAQRLGNMVAPSANVSSADLSDRMIKFHSHPDMERLGVHPHLEDDTHHLKNIIKDLHDDPDSGYFLKKEEYK